MSRSLTILLLVLLATFSNAQEQVLDKVIAVVGKYPVLLSDLQNAIVERDKEQLPPDRCLAYEMLVYNKLLVAQADRDSLTVSDAEVDNELSRRMGYFINQFGSEEKLEQFYGKRINVLKDELRNDVQDQMLADKMEAKITGEIKLTPAEVRLFYNTIPKDSLPLIESEVELQQIVKKPTFSPEAKKEARDRIEGYRQRVMSGQTSMSMLARLYSEDPGSAREGGFFGNVARGATVPEFEAVAFRLKNGEISNVFETVYGYHFIELVQRKGDLVDLRHILVTPKMSPEDFFKCKNELDSIYAEVKSGRITFEQAVKKYSDDDETKQSAGLMINGQTASTKWDQATLRMIDPENPDRLIVALTGLEVGGMTAPMQYVGHDGKRGYRIIKLKNRIDPHRANMKDDYQKILLMASGKRRRDLISNWIRDRSKITYIKLDPEFACKFENNWTLSQ